MSPRPRPRCRRLLALSLLLGACGKGAGDSSGGDGNGGDGGGDGAALLDHYTLSGDTMFPESIAFHAGQRAFFVGSLETGVVTRIEADGTQSALYSPEAGWMSLGLKVDPSAGDVWVCATYHYGEPDVTSSLWVLDPESGALLHNHDLGAVAPGAVCNDLTFSPTGDVYITDREGPNLYRVQSNSTVELWLTDPALSPVAIGQNGVAWTPEGDLLVGKYAPPELLRISTGESPTIEAVTVSGDGLGSIPDGPDGFAWQGDTLVIAANAQAFSLSSTDGWVTASSSLVVPEAPIAAVTVAEGRVYGLKGEVVPWVLGQEVELPFAFFDLEIAP